VSGFAQLHAPTMMGCLTTGANGSQIETSKIANQNKPFLFIS
jgi:hypothetical protein